MGDSPERFEADFDSAYEKAKNRLVRDFTNTFCQEDGSIDWKKLVEDSSKEEKPLTENPRRRMPPKNARIFCGSGHRAGVVNAHRVSGPKGVF